MICSSNTLWNHINGTVLDEDVYERRFQKLNFCISACTQLFCKDCSSLVRINYSSVQFIVHTKGGRKTINWNVNMEKMSSKTTTVAQ